jgi:hypothetical protein
MFVLIQLIMALLYNIICFPGSSQTSTHSDSHDTILYWPSWDHLRCASRQSGAPHAGATWAFLCILSHVIFYSSKFFFHVYLKERLKIYLDQWISFIWIHLYNPKILHCHAGCTDSHWWSSAISRYDFLCEEPLFKNEGSLFLCTWTKL